MLAEHDGSYWLDLRARRSVGAVGIVTLSACPSPGLGRARGTVASSGEEVTQALAAEADTGLSENEPVA